jgi:putative Mg2+ transporter-C (MgtC) family protein
MELTVTVAPIAAQVQLLALTLWSMVLGGLMGLERQLLAKPAGLRTHILVAGAACLLTGVTAEMAAGSVAGDPTRGIHAIITGIGFLGAGAILQQRNINPSGLTTAATVLYTAVTGAVVAVGYGLVATVTTAVAIIVLRLLGRGRINGGDRRGGAHAAPHDEE